MDSRLFTHRNFIDWRELFRGFLSRKCKKRSFLPLFFKTESFEKNAQNLRAKPIIKNFSIFFKKLKNFLKNLWFFTVFRNFKIVYKYYWKKSKNESKFSARKLAPKPTKTAYANFLLIYWNVAIKVSSFPPQKYPYRKDLKSWNPSEVSDFKSVRRTETTN